MINPLIAATLAYLLGSISSAVLLAKYYGLVDPRVQGSGNPGATNMLRLAGKKLGVLTFMGDALKGFLPVLLTRYVQPELVQSVMLGVFLGHLYPIYFKFKGGKGIATMAGVYLGLYWPLGLSLIAIWLMVMAKWRISSLSAIVSTGLSPIACYYFCGRTYLMMSLIIALAVLWRHQSNFRKLWQGNEPALKF